MTHSIQSHEVRWVGATNRNRSSQVISRLSVTAVLLLFSQASAEPIVTRVGNPGFTPVNFVQFSAAAESPEEADAIFASIYPEHKTYVDTGFRIGPGDPHGPPYEMEASLGAENAGFQTKDIFTIDEFTLPQILFFTYQIVANEDAPRGPSPNFADGPVISNDIFPITWTPGVVKNGQFVQGPIEIQIASLSDEGTATDVDGNTVDFTGLNWSHIPFFSNQFVFPDFPIADALGDYEWRGAFRDAGGNGWDVSVPFTVVPEPSELVLAGWGIVCLITMAWRHGSRQIGE